MSETSFDLAPPATWQRFEELCADTFEAVFRDNGLVRYGRSGQSQFGVDILGTDGAISLVGIQCKRKGRWPVKALTIAEVDAEVAKALKFRPALDAYYIVTTAIADTALTDHALALTKAHRAKGLFPVHVIGWQEVCRRVALHPAVGRKHFGIYGGEAPSPLIGTLVTQNGRLVVDDTELALLVRELRHAWRSSPDGRLVVRQQESETLMAAIKAIPLADVAIERRLQRVELQDRLETLEAGERDAETALRLLLTDPALEGYAASLNHDHAAAMVRSIVERRLDRDRAKPGSGDYKLKLLSPLDDDEDVSSFLFPAQAAEIRALIDKRQARFGRAATGSLVELPSGVMSTVAIPLVLDRLVQLMAAGETLEGLGARGMLRIGSWRVHRAY